MPDTLLVKHIVGSWKRATSPADICGTLKTFSQTSFEKVVCGKKRIFVEVSLFFCHTKTKKY